MFVLGAFGERHCVTCLVFLVLLHMTLLIAVDIERESIFDLDTIPINKNTHRNELDIFDRLKPPFNTCIINTYIFIDGRV